MSISELLNHREKLAGPTEAVPARPDPVRSKVVRMDPEVDAVRSIVEQAEALLERHAGSPTAYARLAHAHLAMGSADEARKAAKKALQLASDVEDRPALVAAATVLAAVGDSGIAEDAFANPMVGAPAYLAARLAAERCEWDLVIERLSELDNASARGLRGLALLRLGRQHKAVHEFRVALREVSSPDLYINLGYAQAASGNLRAAIAATESAVHLSPTNRTAKYNLAAYHSVAGDGDRALAAVVSLARSYPEDVSVRLAIAEVHARFGRHDLAERELRRAADRAAAWDASRDERAALRANLAVVRWLRGKLTRPAARSQVKDALAETDYESIAIARLLLTWQPKLSDRPEIEDIVAVLEKLHTEDQLRPLRCYRFFLRLELDDALAEARLWEAEDPLDASAAVMLTYLLAEGAGRFDEAATVGLAAIRRMPAEPVLRNNVAYALARAGDLDSAERVLARVSSDASALVLATAGLIRILRGDVDGGLELYERAALDAEARGDRDMADLIRLRAAAEAADRRVPTRYDVTELSSRLAEDPRLHSMRALGRIVFRSLPSGDGTRND